jgi:tRNA pseudouridine38-40 synthase
MRYFIEIAYRGTNYHGWQIQNNSPNTVQGLLNKALLYTLGHETDTIAGGRTDAGVHCKSQYLHFDTEKVIDKQVFLQKINRILPPDIHVKDILQVANDFHARFSALTRSYEYHICIGKNPFIEGLALLYWQQPTITLMNEAAKILLQHTDFECFSKVKTEVNNFNCTIHRAEWILNNQELVFYITANRFLRGMVRAIVGTLLDVGNKKTSLQEFENIILSKKRAAAGKNVAPEGLFLVEIAYPPFFV